MKIVKRYPVMIGDPKRVLVHLVGCGGTGSFLALHLARMAYDARRDGLSIDLVFHDGDRVEAKNVGRQNFIPGEVGESKALALARRYSLAFGLEIEARPKMFDREVTIHGHLGRELVVLVGAVDTPRARQEIEAAADRASVWWLDAGNHEHAGQVLLGNRAGLKAPEISPLGFCSGLPLPSVAAPDLVAAPPDDEIIPIQSCAELLAIGAQSLMINQVMAGWAAAMLSRLVLSRDLDYWQVWVDLASGSARSAGIVKE